MKHTNHIRVLNASANRETKIPESKLKELEPYKDFLDAYGLNDSEELSEQLDMLRMAIFIQQQASNVVFTYFKGRAFVVTIY
jgi:hypothetical protein